jgi:hypothetical protein
MEYLALQARWLPAHALALDRMLDRVLLTTSSDTLRQHNRWLHHRYLILVDFYAAPQI